MDVLGDVCRDIRSSPLPFVDFGQADVAEVGVVVLVDVIGNVRLVMLKMPVRRMERGAREAFLVVAHVA